MIVIGRNIYILGRNTYKKIFKYKCSYLYVETFIILHIDVFENHIDNFDTST